MNIDTLASKIGSVMRNRGHALTAALQVVAVATFLCSAGIGGLSAVDLDAGGLASAVKTLTHDEEQLWNSAEVFEGKRVWVRQF